MGIAIGEELTEERAAEFVNGLKQRTIALVDMLGYDGYEFDVRIEFLSDVELMRWNNGSPYLRGHSDFEIEVARVFVDNVLTERVVYFYKTDALVTMSVPPSEAISN